MSNFLFELWLFVKYPFNAKKRHFKRMLKDIVKTIWEVEFKKFKGLVARESTRRQFDQLREAHLRAKEQNHKDTEVLEKATEKVKEELKELDSKIHGPNDSQGNPGIDQQLRAYVELRELCKRFIEENC